MFGSLTGIRGLGASALRAKLTGDWQTFARELATFYGNEGKMLKLDIDSAKKSITVEVQLKGQPAPWRIQADGYQITEREGDEHLTFDAVEANEEWLDTALRFAGLAKKGVRLPSEYAEMLKLAL